MNHSSRLTGLFASMFLVAFVLVTSGFACGDVGSSGTMVGMKMGANHANNTNSPESKPPVPPCKFPWAPDGCQSMAPCSPAAVASATTNRHSIVAVPERMAAGRQITPTSIANPPELPPPRA